MNNQIIAWIIVLGAIIIIFGLPIIKCIQEYLSRHQDSEKLLP